MVWYGGTHAGISQNLEREKEEKINPSLDVQLSFIRAESDDWLARAVVDKGSSNPIAPILYIGGPETWEETQISSLVLGILLSSDSIWRERRKEENRKRQCKVNWLEKNN